jgi:hypothetical protein
MPGRRNIYDASGITPLEEKMLVRPRQGKFKGQLVRLTYIRRHTGHVRVYIQPLAGQGGTWCSPRSVDVVL